MMPLQMIKSRKYRLWHHTLHYVSTPEFERNMDDDMLKALAKNGGVIQINFGSSFVTAGWRLV